MPRTSGSQGLNGLNGSTADAFDIGGAALARRSLFGLALAALAPSPSRAQQGGDPRAPIVELNNALQAAMRQGATPFPQRFERLAAVIDRVFDLDTILRTSVGLQWNAMDEAGRRTLASVFRAFTVARYTANFDSYGGEKFDIQPQLLNVGNDRVVQTVLTTGSGETHRINYLMRAEAAGWRVVDILLDGSISQVAVQRSDFRALLRGGSADPLITNLRQKVSELSKGTLRS